MSQYDYAVFIGRMQPPHKEHINQIKRGLELADRVIICLGSHRAAPNIKNPWTTKEREEMIRAALDDAENIDQYRVEFTKVRDYYYNNTAWFTDLYNKVYEIAQAKPNAKICLIGARKDDTSWYLDALPEQWKRELDLPHRVMNATDVRSLYFEGDLKFSTDLLDPVTDYLMEWSKTDKYYQLQDEYRFIKKYKEQWASAPYQPTFVTTDAVVVKNGHVLVVRRKFNPGKGLLALPGGFVNPNENIKDSAFRELKEETRILMPKHKLLQHLVDEKVFDHPGRSLRGRTITHAYCVHLPDGGELPGVKGSDDAEHALWVPVADLFVREREFYEDHCHIIEWFTRKM